MKKMLHHVHTVINRSIFVGERYEKNIRNIAVVNSILIVLGAVLFTVNIIHGDSFTALSPLTFFILSTVALLLLVVKKSRKASVIVSMINVITILTYDVVIISNGFAFLWTLFVPLAVCFLLGLKEGIILTAYFQLLFFVVFYTPLNKLVEGHFSDIVLQRFPLLYLFNAIITIYAMYRYYESVIAEIDHADIMKAEIKKQTSEALARAHEFERLSYEVVEALAKTIDVKDKYTNGHSFRVAAYSAAIAEKLGWSRSEVDNMYREALLHDIGKIGIPDAVLNKPGRLTPEEYEEIKKHTIYGKTILDGLEDMKNTAEVAMYHHERYDGTGYPTGLSGEDIPPHARIVAIADAYDAMHSDRIYRKAMDSERIRQEFIDQRGMHFDPVYADAIICLIDDGTLDSIDSYREQFTDEIINS